MNMMRTTIVVILLAFVCQGYAQQDPMYTQYMFNTLSINSAYAGSADYLTANAIYRHQWVDFKGAPTTQTLAIHGPLKKESISLGGSIVNDAHGPVNQTGLYGDISYRIFFDQSRLAFGLKAGINLYRADLVNLNPVVEDDPVFGADISNKTLPNFGFGVLWYSKKHYLGLSAPKLLSNKLIDGELPDFENNRERQHFFLIGGLVMDVNPYTKFKPAFLVKAVPGAPISFDITANFMFYERLWVGGMYRLQDAVGLLLQYEVNNKIRVGYAYDYTLSDIGDYTSGSHEIMLGVEIGRKPGGDISPRYF
jgi:type IX secretion system PorP/SprF family membrane protein